MVTKQTFIRGGKKAVRVIADLSLYIIPSVFFIKILEHSGWMGKVAEFFVPYMSYMGLPGEGALIFLMGHISIYSAAAVVMALELTAKQITIACALITMCHAIVIETAVVSKGGANGLLNAGIRTLAAVVTGLLLNFVIPGV
ncbi:MAG: nucleoside recognition domain-containing protein [Clostridia bacterium]